MAGALLLPKHGRLLGSAIGTLTFGLLVTRYGLHGDLLIAVLLLFFVFLFA